MCDEVDILVLAQRGSYRSWHRYKKYLRAAFEQPLNFDVCCLRGDIAEQIFLEIFNLGNRCVPVKMKGHQDFGCRKIVVILAFESRLDFL